MSLPNALATEQTRPSETATVMELGPVITDAETASNEARQMNGAGFHLFSRAQVDPIPERKINPWQVTILP